jgi:hypothetical protein
MGFLVFNKEEDMEFFAIPNFIGTSYRQRTAAVTVNLRQKSGPVNATAL